MGQYQQWLLAQEAGRRLKAEKEALETELFYLQDRIALFEQNIPERANMLLQALQAHMYRQADTPGTMWDQARHSQQGQADHMPSQLETPQVSAEGASAPIPAFQPDADKSILFNESGQTDPHLYTWPLRSHQPSERPVGEEPHDAETQRLNEDVQRWFTRWNRQKPGTGQVKEK